MKPSIEISYNKIINVLVGTNKLSKEELNFHMTQIKNHINFLEDIERDHFQCINRIDRKKVKGIAQ